MPFKVRCKLMAFMGDEETFPCHFGYKVGDEFIYDGEKFIGRVCLGLITSMAPAIKFIHDAGNHASERVVVRYGGMSRKDPSMKPYDGDGYAPLKEVPACAAAKLGPHASARPPTALQGGWPFVCGDSKTSALFIAEPMGLAKEGFDGPYYRREMSILEKVRAEPGIGADEILERFTTWEREEIFPPLTPIMVSLMLDELLAAGYIEMKEGRKCFASPSKPG